jgi:hypothetical protein
VVALVVAVLGLVTVRLELFDPYRPGTSHRVEVNFYATCLNAEPLYLNRRTWASEDVAPKGWVVDRAGAVTGTLEVVERGHGVFTADVGGAITFVRMPGLGGHGCLID